MNISLIEQEIKNIQTELEVISRILQTKKERPLDAIEIRGAALSLGALYNGMEKILYKVYKIITQISGIFLEKHDGKKTTRSQRIYCGANQSAVQQ